jgi:hypothetical protein
MKIKAIFSILYIIFKIWLTITLFQEYSYIGGLFGFILVDLIYLCVIIIISRDFRELVITLIMNAVRITEFKLFGRTLDKPDKEVKNDKCK